METNQTDAIKKTIQNGKDGATNFFKERKDIVKRTLFSIFFVIVLSILRILLTFITVIQYCILIITTSYNSNLREFSNKIITYIYKILRYITLCDSECPYPFSDFPNIIETPEKTIKL